MSINQEKIDVHKIDAYITLMQLLFTFFYGNEEMQIA